MHQKHKESKSLTLMSTPLPSNAANVNEFAVIREFTSYFPKRGMDVEREKNKENFGNNHLSVL